MWRRLSLLMLLLFDGMAANHSIAQNRASADPETLERQAYWYSRYNLNAMLLMTGFGLRLVPPPDKPKQLASIAAFDLKQMPRNAYLLRAVYAAGDPHFQRQGNFQDLSTLYWDRSKMDQRFEPAAQAFTIIKATSKGLRTEYHRGGKDRFIALVQLQEAKAMAQFLKQELTREEGLVAAKAEGGDLESPNPYDQAAALWAYSSLSLALSDPDLPLYSELSGSASEAREFALLADALFDSMTALSPQNVKDMAITIEAYGWYAAATGKHQARREALTRAARLGEQLMTAPKAMLDDLAFAVYGLGEAARLSGDPKFSKSVQKLFFEKMEQLWDSKAGVYATNHGVREYSYTPERVAAVIAALNTVRLHHRPGVGGKWDPRLADRRYATFFENAVVRSGLQQAHAIPLAVNPAYLKEERREHFTDSGIPLSIDGDGPYGLCPVYASHVTFDGQKWKVVDRTFRPAGAMLLAVVSTWQKTGAADGFVPVERLMQRALSLRR